MIYLFIETGGNKSDLFPFVSRNELMYSFIKRLYSYIDFCVEVFFKKKTEINKNMEDGKSPYIPDYTTNYGIYNTLDNILFIYLFIIKN